jgi:hypothetical protein
MEKKCELGQGTITKNYGADREMSPNMTRIFLERMGINQEWWETGKGEILAKKPTQVEIKGESLQKKEEMKLAFYKDLIEGDTEYILQHRSMIDEYSMVPKEILKMLSQTNIDKSSLEEKYEKLITELKQEIELLRKKVPPDSTR